MKGLQVVNLISHLNATVILPRLPYCVYDGFALSFKITCCAGHLSHLIPNYFFLFFLRKLTLRKLLLRRRVVVYISPTQAQHVT